ncbi:hypothetical protein thsps117_34880 [Pseudomonas sp. No.117]
MVIDGKTGLMHTGKDLSIRYPFADVSIDQDCQLKRQLKTPAMQPKTLGNKGL